MQSELDLWPAIVHYSGLDELEIVENQSQWDKVIQTGLRPSDRLITSNGAVWALSPKLSPKPSPKPSPEKDDFVLSNTGHHVSTDEAVTLARSHFAALEQCCVSKFNARSIRSVIDALIEFENSA